MKIAVLGAGVVGIAAAWWLARDGHEVTVLERHPGPAQGTSYANAGLVSPGDATAWASPDALKTFFKGLYRRDLGIRVRLQADPYFYAWTLRFLRECTTEKMRANTLVKLRMALHSRTCINLMEEETGVAYDQRKRGIVYFFRSQHSLDTGTTNYRFLGENGLPIEIVDRKRLVELEPGLAGAAEKIAGAVYSPIDQTGDSRLFATRLVALAKERFAVDFRFDTVIEGFDVERGRVTAVRTSNGPVAADAFVLSLGPESGLLARAYGIDLPVYPVKGYALTVPLDDPAKGPTMGGADEDRLIGYSRLGDRLRLTSTAEFTGFDRSHRPENFRTMLATGHDLFPGAFDERRAEMWAGLRPMMPNSVPVFGKARFENLYLNTGHGHLGWTMAAGSGQFISDLVAGRKPAVDPTGLLYEG
ncbi:MAG: D-amino acid dehydrogenase [Rhizobiaceae bacterium]|nr:D-amino acid dehydrogenase [Rhizobiaceae bacterium]